MELTAREVEAGEKALGYYRVQSATKASKTETDFTCPEKQALAGSVGGGVGVGYEAGRGEMCIFS